MLRKGNKTGIVGRPRNIQERTILATECVAKYKFTIPTVIDSMEGSVNAAYDAAPVRTAILDRDGKVVYYAGPGPFDFKIYKIERVLKKLWANAGYMPAPPELQWRGSVNGLRYGIAFDPPKLSLGDDVLVNVKFENTGDNLINLLYQGADDVQGLAIKNSQGQTLTVKPYSDRFSKMMRRRNKRNPIKKIQPGQAFETTIEGELLAVSEDQQTQSGKYTAVSSYEVTPAALTKVDAPAGQTLWTGKITSGKVVLHVAASQKESCVDCHGGTDYHHSDFQSENCDNCHSGKAGTDTFDVKPDACSQCHLRQNKKGRRQILGPAGQFALKSSHISGLIDDNSCLICHEMTDHGKGRVRLSYDDKIEAVTDTGPPAAFCLSCHDGDPPAKVIFPAKAKGSGYDKSAFSGFGHGPDGPACNLCHNSHGSNLPSLLKNMHN